MLIPLPISVGGFFIANQKKIDMNNCEIQVWTALGAAGYSIVNTATEERIEMNRGFIEKHVLDECFALSRITGMKIVINKQN